MASRNLSDLAVALSVDCLFSSAVPAPAQETRGRITGTITDEQGAVMPGVTVTVLNTSTNVSTSAVTLRAASSRFSSSSQGPTA